MFFPILVCDHQPSSVATYYDVDFCPGSQLGHSSTWRCFNLNHCLNCLRHSSSDYVLNVGDLQKGNVVAVLILCRILRTSSKVSYTIITNHLSINFKQLLCLRRTSSQHNVATTIFHHGDGALRIMCCVIFLHTSTLLICQNIQFWPTDQSTFIHNCLVPVLACANLS